MNKCRHMPPPLPPPDACYFRVYYTGRLSRYFTILLYNYCFYFSFANTHNYHRNTYLFGWTVHYCVTITAHDYNTDVPVSVDFDFSFGVPKCEATVCSY